MIEAARPEKQSRDEQIYFCWRIISDESKHLSSLRSKTTFFQKTAPNVGPYMSRPPCSQLIKGRCETCWKFKEINLEPAFKGGKGVFSYLMFGNRTSVGLDPLYIQAAKHITPLSYYHPRDLCFIRSIPGQSQNPLYSPNDFCNTSAFFHLKD